MGEIEYNFLKREVYIPKKYFIKDRHVKLGRTENIFFAVLWFSKEHKATYKELFKRVYGYPILDKKILRCMGNQLRQKGIKIKCIYKYGYQLEE